MIFSKLDAKDTLEAYPPALRRALEFLRRAEEGGLLSPGRHEIDGERMFANVMDMTTHPYEGSHPEVHKKYIDLMYWPEGGEKIGVAPFLGTEAIFRDDPAGDITLLENAENESILTATAGFFGIFFPWDAHRPGLMLGETPATSRKYVIKISMECLKEGGC